MRAYLKASAGALLIALATTSAHAGGFGVAEHSVRANGLAGAYGAVADDPSAIWYQPAALGFLRGLQATSGVTVFNGRFKFEPDRTSNSTRARARYQAVPHIFASAEITDSFNVGFGFNAPFGLALDWPDQADTRFNNQLASLRIQYMTPTVAFRPNQWISIGAGFIYATTRRVAPGFPREGLRLNQAVDTAESVFQGLRAQLPASTPDDAVRQQARAIAATVPEPMSRLKADGDGTGYTLGVLLKPTENFSFGLSFRSEVNVRAKGDVEFAGVQDPIGLPPGTFTDSLQRSRIRASLVLPPGLSIQTAVRLKKKLQMSFQADWTGWSSVDEINIRLVTGSPVAVNQLELNWRDSWSFRVGVEYLVIGDYDQMDASSLKDKELEGDPAPYVLALRAGYVFDESPAPGETLSAFLPDNDRHGINFGVGLDLGWSRIDVSASYLYFKTTRRDVTTPGIDEEFHPTTGKFEGSAIFFGLGGTLRF